MTDDNIYARYYTEAMQRIDLPAGAAAASDLQYNGNEIQQAVRSAPVDRQPYTSGAT